MIDKEQDHVHQLNQNPHLIDKKNMLNQQHKEKMMKHLLNVHLNHNLINQKFGYLMMLILTKDVNNLKNKNKLKLWNKDLMILKMN